MVDLLYNFILNTFLGNPEFEGATLIATLLTYTVIVVLFMLFIKLTLWAFGLFKWKRIRK